MDIWKSLQKIPCYWEVWAPNYTNHTLMCWNVSTNSEKTGKIHFFSKGNYFMMLKRYIYHVIYGWEGIIKGFKAIINTFYSVKPVKSYMPLNESIFCWNLDNFQNILCVYMLFYWIFWFMGLYWLKKSIFVP